MYKFTSQLSKANLVLVQKKFGDGSCAALLYVQNPRRFASNSAPPKKKSHKLLWGTIGLTVLTGAGVVYAKSSPEVRNWLATNAPPADDFIAFVYQENSSYGQVVGRQFNKATAFVGGFIFGKDGGTPVEIPPAIKKSGEKEAEKASTSKPYVLPPKKMEPLYVEPPPLVEPPAITAPATIIKTEECEPVTRPSTRITKDMVELEQDMHENTKLAIDKYKEATKHAEAYNKALFKTLESKVDDSDKKTLASLSSAGGARESAAAVAKEASAKAKTAIDTLDRMIQAGVEAPPETVFQTQRHMKQFRADLAAAEAGFKHQLEQGEVADRFCAKVRQAREAYKSELQMLYPGLDLDARHLDLKGDTDLLLMYTLRQINFLQSELAELQTIRDLKLNRALATHDEKALIEAKAEDMYKKELMNKFKEQQITLLKTQAEFSRQTKEALKKQYEVHQEVMQDRIKRKEAEIMAQFQKQLSEKMQEERVAFKKELAAMAGKLQAIEQTLKQRAGHEAEARRSQSLWAAAEALLAATKRNTEEADVANELDALRKAGKDDELVVTILKGIPPDAEKNGVITEKTLRTKFEEMERTAKKVALVGKDGATLPVYFLSWLQSKLLFSKADIPADELENKPTDFTELDTFDIMQRARYHMDHNNVTDALRYVNLLQGGARAAARCWADAARRHLAVRQAAEAVMAHASVSGLLYL
ncbi:MICOS complex subunit Mic60 [Plutella xylostella]|uniref:MICOS complex subunit Mic60 n=1 Tax=Plutella xylostella TaxID=51655 RepID=UPI002032B6C1|nr:MICOS complex subunit Mic60 [Plutella xylostella]